MSRVEVVEQPVAERMAKEGLLHEVRLPSSAEDILLVENEDSLYEQEHALIRGAAVVSLAWHDKLDVSDEATLLIVYIEKIIEERRSAHRVGFGKFEHAGKGDVTVALKPFYDYNDALREFHGYTHLDSLGIETFDPVGIFPSRYARHPEHDNHFVLVSKKRNDFQSLDRDEWIVGRRVRDGYTAEVAERNTRTVKEISQLFAYIHANGVFHPDGQIKNFAVTETGTVGVIDTENLIRRDLGDIDSVEFMWNDINKLVSSLILDTQEKIGQKRFGVGMLAEMSLVDVRNSLKELVVDPYIEALDYLLTESDEVHHEHIMELYDGMLKKYEHDKQWPSEFMKNTHAGVH